MKPISNTPKDIIAREEVQEASNPEFTEASSRENIGSGEPLSTLFGKIKKFFSDLKTVAFTNSYNDLDDKPTIPDISTKVSKEGDNMTGTLNMKTENNVCFNLRASDSNWFDTISTQTAGNEAVVFATAKNETSWIFINGENSVTNHDSNRWQSLTPALQIKKNCVTIGKLIANNVDPAYKCEINGASYTKGLVVEGNATGGGSADDEGIVIKPAPNNGWAGVILGSTNARRAILYLPPETGNPHIKFSPDGISSYRATFQAKTGTVALTSDIPEVFIITRTTSSSSYSITVPISTWDNYAIQLFGVGNGLVLTGVIAIQKAPTYVVSSGHITLDYSATGTISISKNSGNSITINGLQSNGHYTLISSKKFG